jgi:hypothetical protein
MMRGEYLPLAAWHLIKRTALQHPPKIMGAVAGFFALQVLMNRLRNAGWGDSLLLALILTSLIVFVAASVYTLLTQPGYHLLLNFK